MFLRSCVCSRVTATDGGDDDDVDSAHLNGANGASSYERTDKVVEIAFYYRFINILYIHIQNIVQAIFFAHTIVHFIVEHFQSKTATSSVLTVGAFAY